MVQEDDGDESQMKYIPNRQKACSQCGKVILYNEEYITTDTLTEDNDVFSTHMHMNCRFAGTSGISQGLLASSYALSAYQHTTLPQNKIIYGRFNFPEPYPADSTKSRTKQHRISKSIAKIVRRVAIWYRS